MFLRCLVSTRMMTRQAYRTTYKAPRVELRRSIDGEQKHPQSHQHPCPSVATDLFATAGSECVNRKYCQASATCPQDIKHGSLFGSARHVVHMANHQDLAARGFEVAHPHGLKACWTPPHPTQPLSVQRTCALVNARTTDEKQTRRAPFYHAANALVLKS